MPYIYYMAYLLILGIAIPVLEYRRDTRVLLQIRTRVLSTGRYLPVLEYYTCTGTSINTLDTHVYTCTTRVQ